MAWRPRLAVRLFQSQLGRVSVKPVSGRCDCVGGDSLEGPKASSDSLDIVATTSGVQTRYEVVRLGRRSRFFICGTTH